MKKQYIAPEVELVIASPTSMICESEEGVTVIIHANENLFEEDEEEEDENDNDLWNKDLSLNWDLWD